MTTSYTVHCTDREPNMYELSVLDIGAEFCGLKFSLQRSSGECTEEAAFLLPITMLPRLIKATNAFNSEMGLK